MKQTIFLLLVLSLMNCTSSNKNSKSLSVTIEPQRYFVEQIVGNEYLVNCIVPAGSNPESFDLPPSQLVAISKSKLYFKVGFFGIENTLINNVGVNNPNMQFVDCSQGIAPIEEDKHLTTDNHSHKEGHNGTDPHIWSSPATAAVMAKNIYRAILKLDKDKKEYYTANYNKLTTEFNATDSIIRRYIAKAPCKSFIIYHAALSYYAQEYGLKQYSIENEGKNPSPSQLKNLIDIAIEQGIKVVFVQQEFDVKNAQTISDAIGGKIVPINLLSYNWSEEMIKIARELAHEDE